MVDSNLRRRKRKAIGDSTSIRAAHEAGESVLALSKRLGVNRSTIAQRIREAGGEPRGSRAANILVAANKTPEQHRAGAQAAQEARRNKGASHAEKVKRAASRGKVIGAGENEIANAARAAGLPVDQQAPVGIYNVDVLVGSIAVEVIRLPSSHLRDPAFRERAKYLRDCGLCVVLVTFRKPSGVSSIVGNLDHVVAFLERADCTPALRSKDWMIRCSAERFSRTRDDRGQFSAIPATERFLYAISEWDAG